MLMTVKIRLILFHRLTTVVVTPKVTRFFRQFSDRFSIEVESNKLLEFLEV
jgi:hypothetical protein